MSRRSRWTKGLCLAVVALLVGAGVAIAPDVLKMDLGHLGSRAAWQLPDRVIDSLGIRPGDRVADVGAGDGYFTFRLAEAVGSSGKVYTVEVDDDLVERLEERVRDEGHRSVVVVRGESADPLLPDGEIDLALFCNSYHDGLVVAAHHTVDADDGVSVGLDDGRAVAARVVGRDPRSDLVLLQSEVRGLPTPTWANTASVAAGRLVVGLSRPGQVPRARLGMVSAVSGAWRTPGGAPLERYIESDLPLHPGFSGGPLVGSDGTVLGLNNAGVLRQTSLALAAEDVRGVVEDLRELGRVRRGYLGIGTQVAVLSREDQERLGQETALLVVAVHSGSPAAKAGLLLGDALLGLGEDRLTRPTDLLPALDAEGIGRTLELTVLRAGERRRVPLEVGERERP